MGRRVTGVLPGGAGCFILSTMIELPLIDLSDERTIPMLSEAGAEFLRLMADPTRRRIFLHLMAGEVCNCELVGQLGLAQNLISHHLRQLRQAGLIRARRDARDQRWVYYTVDRDVLAQRQRELMALFDPARLGQREPDCGPAAQVDQ
jgi:ArsR family transcriptional regulator, arsenate/arsenite/antimonite-responsive transcriptional repressor